MRNGSSKVGEPLAPSPVRPQHRTSRVSSLPRAGAVLVVSRFLGWLGLMLRLAIRTRLFHSAPAERGRAFRELLQARGDTAIVIGRNLAVRIDLLPAEICQELRRLRDVAPPVALDHAIERIEQAYGRPMAEVFESFDPQPIGCHVSRTIFQGVLLDGTKVAVQVRRPGVDRSLDADLRAISLALWVAEWTSFVRPGFYRSLRRELRSMIAEEVDFVRRAKVTRTYRRRIRKDRVRFLTACRTHDDQVTNDVLVNDFAAGFFLYELLDACEADDEAALARFAAARIDPRRVARRLLHACWWGMFENIFFFTNPSPFNIVLEPGSRLVLLDFAETASVTNKLRRIQLTVMRSLLRGDVTMAAQLMVQAVLPLPYIDVDDLTKRVENRLWHHHFALRAKKASRPLDRTFSSAWFSFLEVARGYDLAIPLETLRMVHTTYLYEALACRLWPGIDGSAYRRYEVKSFRRNRRRRERLRRTLPAPSPLRLLDEGTRKLDRQLFWAGMALSESPLEFMAATGKGSYAAAVVLRGLAIVGYLLLGSVLLDAVVGVFAPDVDLVRAVFTNPVTVAALLVLFVAGIRLIQFRLSDTDPQDERRR